MDQSLERVTLRISREGNPVYDAFIGLDGEKLATNAEGVVTFSNVAPGLKSLTVEYGGKRYASEILVVSSEIEVPVSTMTLVNEIPVARQDAYRVAYNTTAMFAGIFTVLAIMLCVAFFAVDIKLRKAKSYVRFFLKTALLIAFAVAGVYVYAFMNGTQDRLFAMLLPSSSSRASEFAVPSPASASAQLEGEDLVVRWTPGTGQNAPEVTAYVVRWTKAGDEILMDGITTVPEYRIPSIQAGSQVQIEIIALSGTLNPVASQPSKFAVTAR
jgi:hypothetical protein